MKILHAAATHPGKVRGENQDSVLAMPELGVFLVADGMGGARGGAEASACVAAAVEAVARSRFCEAPPQSPAELEALLGEALARANRAVHELSLTDPEMKGMGSTGTLLALRRGAYALAHVGDSRAYLKRGRDIWQLTHDHTHAWEELYRHEENRIDAEKLEAHPRGHLLTQCLGGADAAEIDRLSGRLKRGDLFLLCSDGLNDYAGEAKIFEIMNLPRIGVKRRAELLIRAALDGGGGDNVSVVLLRVRSINGKNRRRLKEPAAAREQ